MKLQNYDEIVTHDRSATLVRAGPGAGKTYLLADRVKRLLESKTSKDTITVLTFGRAASQHMYKELVDPTGHFQVDSKDVPRISTMHALGLRLVKESARAVKLRKNNLIVLHSKKAKRLLYRDAALLCSLSEAEADAAAICKQRGDCRQDDNSKNCRVCEKYWEIMSKCNAIDFDDQVLFACRVLEAKPDLLARYQARALHLLVDEYQDINAAQFRMIELLSRTSRRGLFAVGDDAQSIYGFRGADPRLILQFETDFPGAATPPLAHSRRCHKAIVDDAVRVLKQYYGDWSGPHELEYHRPAGDPPAIWKVPSEKAEATLVAGMTRRFVNDNKSVLILAPKKEFFSLISSALAERDVPHACPVDLLPPQASRRLEIVRRLLDWVRNPSDSFVTRLVLEDLINAGAAKVPGANKRRACKPETLKRRIAVEAEIAHLWESVNPHNDLYAVVDAADDKKGPLKTIRESLAELRESFGESKMNLRGEFAKRLALASGVWVDPGKMAEDISEAMSLLETRAVVGNGNVQLMTMRKAKGLEADIVIMVGLENDIIPNPSADVSEEARLFYVSMTRAQEKLFLIHSLRRPRSISYGQELIGKRRSRFLDALGRESDFKKGARKSAKC